MDNKYMNSYKYQSLQENEKQQYRQQLGLRKMLYKYQHQNEQLKNQIKALTQRLQSIVSEKTYNRNEDPQGHAQNTQNAHEKYLSEQMNYYYKRIEQLNGQIKGYKDAIDNNKQVQYVELLNTLKDKQNKLSNLKMKAQKFKLQYEQQNGNINNSHSNTGVVINEQLQAKYTNQLQQLKKRIRELQKTRNNNLKQDINRHAYMVKLETETRKVNNADINLSINYSKNQQTQNKKGGVWGMSLTQQAYTKISEEFNQLKKQKNVLIQSIKVENNNLRQKLTTLKNTYVDLSSNLIIQNSINKSTSKVKQIPQTPGRKSLNNTIILPDIPVPLGNSAYERKNDKNFVPKKINLIEWNLLKSQKKAPGFSWNDQNKKSPITGINIWIDKFVIGLQFIHTLGQTVQHLHAQVSGQIKRLVPIQYRLNNNDYVQNIVLIVPKQTGSTNPVSKLQYSSNSILGFQLYSKNGRKDNFGLKLGTHGTEKFDYGIKAPEKPIYSFGSFTINPITHLSCISSLGFAVI